MRKLFITTLLFSLQIFSVPSLSEQDRSQHVVYWVGAVSQGRIGFETELINLLLQSTEEKYGPYTLELSYDNMTPMRAHAKLKHGHDLDLHTAPVLDWTAAEDSALMVQPNILQNLLGYRRLIVRSGEDRINADNFVSLAKTLRVGQGAGWPDAEVYTHNNLPVTIGPNYENLFPMLTRNRFDYLPLGISESDQALINRKASGLFKQVDNLVLSYPMPVYIMVSKARPKLFERFQYGMDQAIANGSYKQLFDLYFAHVVNALNTPATTVIQLDSPWDEKIQVRTTLLNQAKQLKLAKPKQ